MPKGGVLTATPGGGGKADAAVKDFLPILHRILFLLPIGCPDYGRLVFTCLQSKRVFHRKL